MLTLTRAPHGPLAQVQGCNPAARMVRYFPSCAARESLFYGIRAISYRSISRAANCIVRGTAKRQGGKRWLPSGDANDARLRTSTPCRCVENDALHAALGLYRDVLKFEIHRHRGKLNSSTTPMARMRSPSCAASCTARSRCSRRSPCRSSRSCRARTMRLKTVATERAINGRQVKPTPHPPAAGCEPKNGRPTLCARPIISDPRDPQTWRAAIF